MNYHRMSDYNKNIAVNLSSLVEKLNNLLRTISSDFGKPGAFENSNKNHEVNDRNMLYMSIRMALSFI